MGQVPGNGQASGPARYGFVGDGRVSRHWRHYFTSLGIPWALWSRRLARADDPDAPVTAAEALAACPVVLLAISDDAISSALAGLAGSGPPGRVVMHFCGGRSFAGAFGAHPLMSFGPRLYPPRFYRDIPMFVEQSTGCPDPVARFRELFPELPNPCFPLPIGDKAAYHALCALAGGFPALLWQQFFATMSERYGVPREALAAYPRRILDNVLESGADALTGPVARGDDETIHAHLEALAGGPLRSAYEAFIATARSARP